MAADKVIFDTHYTRTDDNLRWQHVKVTRIYTTDRGHRIVAFDIYGTDGRGRQTVSHSAMPLGRFADLYQPINPEE